MNELKNIIESMLFVSDTPLTVDRIRQVLPETEPGDIRAALAQLAQEYEAREGGFHLREVAGGYQVRTRPPYREYVKRLLEPSPTRLSKAALETLAIIAYKQPVIRSEIEQLRGVDCGGVLRMLMERKLTRVLGRKEIPGRPLIYATTREFLEVFELKDLKDLPTPKEIEELGRSEEEDPATPPSLPDAEESSGDVLDSEESFEETLDPEETSGKTLETGILPEESLSEEPESKPDDETLADD